MDTKIKEHQKQERKKENCTYLHMLYFHHLTLMLPLLDEFHFLVGALKSIVITFKVRQLEILKEHDISTYFIQERAVMTH